MQTALLPATCAATCACPACGPRYTTMPLAVGQRIAASMATFAAAQAMAGALFGLRRCGLAACKGCVVCSPATHPMRTLYAPCAVQAALAPLW